MEQGGGQRLPVGQEALYAAWRPASPSRIDQDHARLPTPGLEQARRLSGALAHQDTRRRVCREPARHLDTRGIVAALGVPDPDHEGGRQVRSITSLKKSVAQEMQGS